MNTNALPRTGGIPLRASPLQPTDPAAFQYPTPQPQNQYAPASQPTPAPDAPSASTDRTVKQPGVGPGSSDRTTFATGPTPADTQDRAPVKPPEQQLKEAIGHASDMLMTASTVFPFTLFPDTVTIDRSKLSVTKRFFFAVSEAFSFRIEDILNVTADTGPFFGSLQITTRFFTTEKKPYQVSYLWRSDALRIKRILQGYIIATTKNIDCSSMPAKKLARMLDELGKGAPSD